MPSATPATNPTNISVHELLPKDKVHLIRAALASRQMSQKDFCDEHGLDTATFSQVMNRKQVPAPHYTEPIESLLAGYVEDMRLIVEKVDQATSTDA